MRGRRDRDRASRENEGGNGFVHPEREGHGQLRILQRDAGGYAKSPLARLRHAAIQAHVLHELAHASGELHRIETRGHAGEPRVSLDDGRVVWHELIMG